MPAPTPNKFTDEKEWVLWRNIARLQEDYQGDIDSFLRVVGDITDTLIAVRAAEREKEGRWLNTATS